MSFVSVSNNGLKPDAPSRPPKVFHTLHTNRYDLLVFYIVDIVDVSTPHFSTYSDDVWIMSGSLLLYCAAAASLFTTGMCGQKVNAQKKFTGVTKAVISMSDQQTVASLDICEHTVFNFNT